jgi:hypothetical protein
MTKCWINSDVIEEFSGKLKSRKESDLRRMIIQMLIKGVLEE